MRTFAWGAASYIALAVLVDVAVVNSPLRNRFVQTILVALLGLAFMVAADGFLAVIRAIPPGEMLGWPFRAAAVGSVAYSLCYGHRVFVNYWFYDDWGYFDWVEQKPTLAFMTGPLNDHFVPLLKILIWGLDRIFGFDYTGAACLQQIAFLMLVLCLAHLLWGATNRPWALILLVGLFALWPSYGIARTWFGGGFLLTASAAVLSVYILHTRGVVLAKKAVFMDFAISATLGVAAVLISSQTLIPLVYLAAFCAPFLLVSANLRFAKVCFFSLLATAGAFLGRSLYIVRKPLDLSGLFDGKLFKDLGAFILNKAFFTFSQVWFVSWRSPAVLTIVLGLPLFAAFLSIRARDSFQPERRARLGSLLLGGGAIFVLSIVQIGLGRSWGYGAMLNTYYATFPFFGLWLAWCGIGFALLPGSARVSPPPPWKAISAAAAVMVTAVAAGAAPLPDRSNEPLLETRLHLVEVQQKFIGDLGAAACDLARLHRNGPTVLWVPSSSILTCAVCQDIIGPTPYLQHFDGGMPLFGSISRLAARGRCSATDLSRVLPSGQVALTAPRTDGSESQAAVAFLQRFFGQPSQRQVADLPH